MNDANSQSDSSDLDRLPGLHWSFKRSFVDYVRRMPDGQTGLGGGATAVDTHEIVYPIVRGGRRTGAGGKEESFWEFDGNLQFKGHHGMLSVQITSPTVFISGGIGTLSIIDPMSPTEDKHRTLVTVIMDKSLETDKLEIWESTEVRLHADGVELFNDVYPEGEPFEHLKIVTPVITAA